MDRFKSLSLFTKLYLTIAMAMMVSGALSVYVINKIHVQGSINEYVNFTDIIYADLVKEGKIVPNTPKQDLSPEVNAVDGYLIGWKYIFSEQVPCNDCEYVANSRSVEVYSNDDNQWFAVYTLPNVDASLVIFETNIFNFSEQEEIQEQSFLSSLSFHDVEDFAQLLIVFFTIGLAIYWPVNVIKRQIERLIRVQHQFGAGDLTVRAENNFSKPIDELATSFNTMANSIAYTVTENQIFAQSVPHETRTPLSRMQLAVGLLRQSKIQEQEALLDNLDTYIGDITVLIDQVVAFSKLNSNKSESETSLYQTLALGEFILSRVKATQCDQAAQLILEVDDAVTVTTNPSYLRLLIDNLLKNAAIHAKTHISISVAKTSEGSKLIIQDDGDGIPADKLKSIFIPFYRTDASRSRKTGGLGLGLSISNAACKRMGASLIAENAPTGGAKFTCLFT